MNDPHVFCDWLSIYQIHHDPLPIVNKGLVVKVSAKTLRKAVETETGWQILGIAQEEVEYSTAQRIEHEGSYETKVQVRCDGHRVELSGNVGRYGRPDNLFGFSVLECVEIASEIAQSLGLPAFDFCRKTGPYARQDTYMSENPVITRVDLTCNYSTGGPENAQRVLSMMTAQAPKRMGKNAAPKAYSNGVTWNEGSKRWYEKLYFKADDLGQFASQEVADYCREQGILRHEVSLKSRELADLGLSDVVGWSRVQEGKRMENVIYGRFAEKLHRCDVSLTDFRDIPGRLGELALAYYNGKDIYKDMTKSAVTRRRWRRELIKYGIDIATAPNVQTMGLRIRVIEMEPLERPGWYDMGRAA